jgi:hypothetical protein
MKNTFSIIMGLTAAAIAHAAFAGNSVNITQVPRDSKPVDGNKEQNIKADENPAANDYQAEILTNPEINERARSEEILKENNFGGNVATIVQTGKSNKSSITQKGNGNYASQTQHGNSNDLRVEQTGHGNHSVEHQTGDNNHKVIIQNGKKREETSKSDDSQDE